MVKFWWKSIVIPPLPEGGGGILFYLCFYSGDENKRNIKTYNEYLMVYSNIHLTIINVINMEFRTKNLLNFIIWSLMFYFKNKNKIYKTEFIFFFRFVWKVQCFVECHQIRNVSWLKNSRK